MQKPHADIALRSCPAVSSIREGVKQCSRHLRVGPGTDQYCLHRAWRRSVILADSKTSGGCSLSTVKKKRGYLPEAASSTERHAIHGPRGHDALLEERELDVRSRGPLRESHL